MIMSKCPRCGAQITFDEKSQAVVCPYCSSVIAVNNNKKNKINIINIFKKIFPPNDYAGVYFHTPESEYQSVYLRITDNGIVFKIVKFVNLFGDVSNKFVPYAEICGYQKCKESSSAFGFDRGFIIYAKEDGNIVERRFEISGLQRDRDSLLNNIEYYRKQYFIKNGQEVPDLDKNSVIPEGKTLIDMRYSYSKFLTTVALLLLMR